VHTASGITEEQIQDQFQFQHPFNSENEDVRRGEKLKQFAGSQRSAIALREIAQKIEEIIIGKQ